MPAFARNSCRISAKHSTGSPGGRSERCLDFGDLTQVLLRAAADSKKQSPTKNHGWLYKVVVPKRTPSPCHSFWARTSVAATSPQNAMSNLYFFNENTGPTVFMGRNPSLTIQDWYPCNIPYILHHITLIFDTFLINLWFVLFQSGSSCTKVAKHSPWGLFCSADGDVFHA